MNNKINFKNFKIIAVVATLCCILWGSAYPSVKIGYALFSIGPADTFSKLVFAGYRFILAGLLVLIIAKISGRKIFNFTRSGFTQIVLLGITQTFLQYIFFYIGLSNTTGVKGAIMNATGTFFSVFLAHFIYKNDKLSLRKLVGCLIGFAGVMIVNFSKDLFSFSFSIKGEGFVIIAAFIFSASAIYGKRISQKIDVMLVTGHNLLIGGILLTLIGTVCGGKIDNFTMASTALLTYMAILSAVAFSLWSVLLKYNKVGAVSVYNFLIPIFGAMLSSIFLGENILEVKNIFALIFVCMGIWLVNKESGGVSN